MVSFFYTRKEDWMAQEEKVTLLCIRPYMDTERKRLMTDGEKLYVTKKRAETLIKEGLCKKLKDVETDTK